MESSLPADLHPSAARLEIVRAEIRKAALGNGRDPAAVTLVAVTKTFGAENILPVIEAGQRVFGENRVQEAKAKWPALKERFPDIELHLIGPLQSNKAREAVALFDAIHTVDRPKIAAALAEEMARAGPEAAALRPGQYRRGAAEGRRVAGKRRCIRRRLPRDLQALDRRA